MLDNTELECVVCFCEFSHNNRKPRILHCGHTFCHPCLERISRQDEVIRYTSCPLCRRITCTPASMTLGKALYIDNKIWDEIGIETEQEKSVKDMKNITPQRIKSGSGFNSIFSTLFGCVSKAR